MLQVSECLLHFLGPPLLVWEVLMGQFGVCFCQLRTFTYLGCWNSQLTEFIYTSNHLGAVKTLHSADGYCKLTMWHPILTFINVIMNTVAQNAEGLSFTALVVMACDIGATMNEWRGEHDSELARNCHSLCSNFERTILQLFLTNRHLILSFLFISLIFKHILYHICILLIALHTRTNKFLLWYKHYTIRCTLFQLHILFLMYTEHKCILNVYRNFMT